ncbi:MAG: GatB/YqeY domain-containing protein, partial [Clostridia bacterium]
MIIEEIKKANVQAMKDKNVTARNIYSILMNKALLETIKKRETGAEFLDCDMVQILQKTIKELTEEAENFRKVLNETEAQNIDKQKEIVTLWLPAMLSEEEISKIILSMDDKSIPAVM